MKICGKKRIDFTNDNGTHIVGTRIYFSVDIPTDRGVGYETDTAFVPDNVKSFDSISMGKECEVLYDKKGKVFDIRY